MWVCDSFILGHPENGKVGWGTILDELETSVVANWTGSGFTVSAGSTARVGSGSMQLDYSGIATKTVTTSQSFGDISAWTGVGSGLPTQGGKLLKNSSTEYGLDLRIGARNNNAGGYVKYHHNVDIRECVHLIKHSSNKLNEFLENLFAN